MKICSDGSESTALYSKELWCAACYKEKYWNYAIKRNLTSCEIYILKKIEGFKWALYLIP